MASKMFYLLLSKVKISKTRWWFFFMKIDLIIFPNFRATIRPPIKPHPKTIFVTTFNNVTFRWFFRINNQLPYCCENNGRTRRLMHKNGTRDNYQIRPSETISRWRSSIVSKSDFLYHSSEIRYSCFLRNTSKLTIMFGICKHKCLFSILNYIPALVCRCR